MTGTQMTNIHLAFFPFPSFLLSYYLMLRKSEKQDIMEGWEGIY
jgi:hypothetical protein